MDENTEAKKTTLSTQIVVQAQGFDGKYCPVGAIRGFNAKQERAFEIVKRRNSNGELFDHLMPGLVSITLNVHRMVFDGLSLTEAFSCGFRAIAAQQKPFNIQVIELDSAWMKDEKGAVITTYHNCWFQSYNTPINAEDYIIIEEAVLICEKQTSERIKNYSLINLGE
jgi:hypothetical protein